MWPLGLGLVINCRNCRGFADRGFADRGFADAKYKFEMVQHL